MSLHLSACICLLMAALFAGCGKKMSEYEKDQAKIMAGHETLLAMGAKLETKRFPQGDAFIVDLSGQTVTDQTFDALAELRNVVEINFSNTNVNDDFMPVINDLKIRGYLMKLDLSNTHVTDAGLDKFTEVYLLNDLNVANTKVTDSGIANLKSRWPSMKIKK